VIKLTKTKKDKLQDGRNFVVFTFAYRTLHVSVQ
jgi:hypothetical protein